MHSVTTQKSSTEHITAVKTSDPAVYDLYRPHDYIHSLVSLMAVQVLDFQYVERQGVVLGV